VHVFFRNDKVLFCFREPSEKRNPLDQIKSWLRNLF
jgi:hypothetical protein